MKIGDLVQDTKETLTNITRIGIITAENRNYYSIVWLFVPKGQSSHDFYKLYGLSIVQHYYKTNKPISIYRVKDGLGND